VPAGGSPDSGSWAGSDIPTIDESGVKGFDAAAWFGMYAPGKMPAELTRKISSDVLEVLKSPRIRAHFAEQGADPGTLPQPISPIS
jgi:tripartite-type tricarboxylate transporter receptor subunit TctC